MAMRIWVQSKTDLTKLPGYTAILADHARHICSPGTTVELHGVQPGTFPKGIAPNDASRYGWLSNLVSMQMVENCVRAEREGFDAVAMSCFGDPALQESRSLVDIPIVSSFETSFQVAATVGQAFGVLSLNEAGVRRSRSRIKQYGYQDRVATVVAMDPPINEHDLESAFGGSPAFVKSFSAQVARMVEAGADLIIPAEGVINTVLVRNNIREVDGVPIIDSYGSLLAYAEMLVQLRRKSGLTMARRGVMARPPTPLLDHVRAVTADMLQDATARAAASRAAE